MLRSESAPNVPAILTTISSVFEKKKTCKSIQCMRELLEYFGEKKMFGHVDAFWTSRNVIWMMFVKKKYFQSSASFFYTKFGLENKLVKLLKLSSNSTIFMPHPPWRIRTNYFICRFFCCNTALCVNIRSTNICYTEAIFCGIF